MRPPVHADDAVGTGSGGAQSRFPPPPAAHGSSGAARTAMQMNLCGAAGGRLGTLAGLGRSGAAVLPLPGCLLYTRTGSAPHLTHDTLQTVGGVPAVAQLTLPTL